MGPRGRWIQGGVAVALVALVVGRWLVVTTTNRLWADALGVAATHVQIDQIRTLLLATAFAAATIWCVGNLYLVYRSIGSVHVPRRLGNIEILEAVPRKYLLLAAVALGLVLAFALSHRAGGWWQVRALAGFSGSLGIADPVLDRDVGYYVYRLPWHRTLHSYVTLLSGVMLAVVGVLYAAVGAVRWHARRLHVADLARMHLAGLLAAFALALFWGYRLEPPEYVAGIHDVPLDTVLTGVRLPVARVLAALALLAAGASILWLWSTRLAIVAVAWTMLAVVSFAGHYVVPPFVGAVRSAEELALESVAAQRRDFTALAYGVGQSAVQLRPAASPEPAALARHAADLMSAPVWDGFAMSAFVRRLVRDEQFTRYAEASLAAYPRTSGRPIPVFIAPGQVDFVAARDAGADLSWERVHSRPYGYASGVVAVLAHRVTESGIPLFVRDLAHPDSATPRVTEVALTRAEVIFAPGASDFAVLPPRPDGMAGVPAGGLLRRSALAWALQSHKLITSPIVHDTSLILWDRDVVARLDRYAPFAEFESTYAVVVRGRLFWLASGYVSGNTFPLAPEAAWQDRTVRYLRSSLIGVVDASSGSTAVYLTSRPDPVSLAWAELTPTLVRPWGELPADLAPHVRYPRGLFDTQVAVLRGATLPESAIGAPAPARIVEVGQPFWFLGPTPADSVDRLRLLAGLETGQPGVLVGIVDGTVKHGATELTLLRVDSALRVPGPAEMARRFTALRGTPAGVQGILRSIPFADGVVGVQASYATPGNLDAALQLADVTVSWGDAVAQGATLEEALVRARTLARPTGVAEPAWEKVRQWFRRMDAARRLGDWQAFGEAYDALRRLLAGQRDTLP